MGLTASADLRKLESGCYEMNPGALMQWFRTKARAIWLLVALFLVAQFAGVVSSPLSQAHAAAKAAIAHASHHQAGTDHADGHRHDGCAHPSAGACTDHADYCCALHAFFAGILPPAAAIDNAVVGGETLRPAVTEIALGLHPGRLDRPPRPLS
jgi:hypothetical protein